MVTLGVFVVMAPLMAVLAVWVASTNDLFDGFDALLAATLGVGAAGLFAVFVGAVALIAGGL